MKSFLVNAFTDQPFTGIPAAVCLLSELKDADWMQKVAREINLSTTAFVNDTNDKCSLRWSYKGQKFKQSSPIIRQGGDRFER